MVHCMRIWKKGKLLLLLLLMVLVVGMKLLVVVILLRPDLQIRKLRRRRRGGGQRAQSILEEGSEVGIARVDDLPHVLNELRYGDVG